MGGDEFTVIAEGLCMPDDAIALCERFTQALSRPVPLAGTEVRVSGSVEICAYPQDGQTVTDLIIELDEWVIDAACSQVRAWRDAGLATCPVAVNVSTRQIARGNLDHCLRQALERHRLEPDALQIELTETAMLTDTPAARSLLQKLEALGVRVAIDDFGTGGATLARLLAFPAHALKIDRSLLVA